MATKVPVFNSDCSSLLAKYLSQQVFSQLEDKVTTSGYTFKQAINSGLVNQDSGVGVYAGDAESYTMFAPLFDPIIANYHNFNPHDSHQSNLHFDELFGLNPDPTGKYILSTRIRVGRNIADMPLGPALSRQQRRTIELQLAKTLTGLSGELSGNYYSLGNIDAETRKQLIADHFLFKAGDRFLDAVGLNRDWPEGRGIFHNLEKTFLVWVNEEDQLRIISMQPGGDIKAVFSRLVKAVNEIEVSVPFLFDQRLGYLTSCPTNLGTALRASVHIRLPKLGDDLITFKAITDHHQLQIRGTSGEHSVSEGGVFDISNKSERG